MKIVSLVGSPRGAKGNTAGLLNLVLYGAQSQGAETETIFLPGGTVLPCLACDACHKKGTCAQKDDFETIKQKIFESDGLVLASPNYIFSVSAQMKAFMDRCCGVIHCMAFEGKYGASVVTSGGGDEEPIADYMNHFMVTTGVTPVGSVWATMGATLGASFPEEIKDQAMDLGKELVRACKNKPAFPEVEKAQNEFKERMRLLMLYRKEEWPYEWEYWQKHRGLA
jgi:multimeric flavodoxin WrbA